MSYYTYLATLRNQLQLASSSNSTNGSFSAVTPTTSVPGTAIDHGNHALVIPFGTDGDDEAFDVRLIGWSKMAADTGTWVPVHLGTVTATLSSTLTGDTGFPNTSSDLIADSLSASAGSDNFDILAGVADVLPAAVLVDMNGCQRLEIQFALDTAASANALYAIL